MANGIFLGTQSQMDEYYKKTGQAPAGLTITKKEEPKKGHRQQSPDDKLDLDSLPPMDEEELYNLKRVRLRNDSDTVYMQSDVDFYDFFYKGGDQIDPLTKAAHQIKRVYMNAEDYFYALDVRDAYIEMVIERDFGGNRYQFNKSANNGQVYVPPTPFYSKRAVDYDVVMAGGWIEHSDPDVDIEGIKEWIDDWWKAKGMRPSDMKNVDDILTTIWMLDEVGESQDSGGLHQNGMMVMSVTDVRAIQDALNDIYQNRAQSTAKGNSRLFSKTPTRIKEDYVKSTLVPVRDMLAQALRGEDIDEKEDDNAMVYDSVTNRPMTRIEYRKRNIIRKLSDAGWSELSLMKALNVGSAYERRKLTEDKSTIRKLKKNLARSLNEQDSYYGSGSDVNYNSSGIPDQYVDPVEELQRYFGGKA